MENQYNTPRPIALNPMQMIELRNLGVNTSDASMAWIMKSPHEWQKAELIIKPAYPIKGLFILNAYTLEDILTKIHADITYGENRYLTAGEKERYSWSGTATAENMLLASYCKTPLQCAYMLLKEIAVKYPSVLGIKINTKSNRKFLRK